MTVVVTLYIINKVYLILTMAGHREGAGPSSAHLVHRIVVFNIFCGKLHVPQDGFYVAPSRTGCRRDPSKIVPKSVHYQRR